MKTVVEHKCLPGSHGVFGLIAASHLQSMTLSGRVGGRVDGRLDCAPSSVDHLSEPSTFSASVRKESLYPIFLVSSSTAELLSTITGMTMYVGIFGLSLHMLGIGTILMSVCERAQEFWL
jgi:hypothetical protein